LYAGSGHFMQIPFTFTGSGHSIQISLSYSDSGHHSARTITLQTMNICTVCGNEIDGSPAACPYCGSNAGTLNTGMAPGAASNTPGGARSSQGAKSQRGPRGSIVTVNIESGMPDVAQALAQLDIRLGNARQQGAALVRVIHGWGSTGSGGRIKDALPMHLARLKRRRVIRGYVPGDQFAISTRQGAALIDRYPVLKESMHTDRKNPGITLVEL
jgi:hypothetical protein